MNYYGEMKNQIFELNKKCFKKIRNDLEEIKKINSAEYTVIRNFLQKKSYHFDELSKLTNFPQETIRDMVKKLGFIQFRQRKLIVQSKFLRRVRIFIEDFINFLNYPKNKKSSKSIEKVNFFIQNQKQPPRNFKITLVGALESSNHLFFKVKELEKMISIIKNSSWGMSMYYFRELYSIYLKFYPEIQSLQLEYAEPEKEEKEEVEPDDVLAEIEEEIDVKVIVAENEKLTEELNESRAVCDFIAIQYEDLNSKMEDTKNEAYEKILIEIFKNFNSLENNNALDAFFIARFTLNKLKKSGWKPSPPELNSALFIFDLFSEFFKRQGLTSRYDIGELVEITLENVDNFNYKGPEIRENMSVITKVLSPAWYLKNRKISKADVIEIKNEED